MDNNRSVMADSKRKIAIDICRVLGTFSIILAHVNSPIMLNHIRCFDVVLLTLISGYCISMSGFINYLSKRFKRLVIPTWVLLTILFVLTGLCCVLMGRTQLYNTKQILRAYCFLNESIGYIWIVRIYMGIAIITPIIMKISNSIRSNANFLLIIILIISMASVAAELKLHDRNEFVFYVVELLSYSSIAMIGYRLKDIQAEETYYNFIVLVIIISGMVSIISSSPEFEPNNYKYPPQAYYVSYGLFVSVLVYCLVEKISKSYQLNVTLERIIFMVSKLSFNIYLIHILILTVLNFVEDYFRVSACWWIKYLIVLLFSVSVAQLLEVMKHRFIEKSIWR